MSDDDDNGTPIERAWRAQAIAERIVDEYSTAIDSHEGVLLALQMAYMEGVNDGLDAYSTKLARKLEAL